jgi:SagB-type dehydrogenase family enzyme
MENLAGKEFIRRSKYDQLEPSGQSLGIPQPPLELDAPKDALKIKLPSVTSIKIPSIDLRQAIEQRVTFRDYTTPPLSIQELSYLLWCTQGVRQITTSKVTKRNVPSAGSRHAFETWLLINKVEGLEPDLYRYMALSHSLIKLTAPKNICDLLTDACKHQKHVHDSAITFFWVAVTDRMIWRYCQRGYRYMFLDAGHVCQNLYLAAEQIGCGVCAIGAYDDDLVNQALELDGENLFTIYIATLGKK